MDTGFVHGGPAAEISRFLALFVQAMDVDPVPIFELVGIPPKRNQVIELIA
jgi:hypothetical protein